MGNWFFYSTLGYTCFWENSSPSGRDHSLYREVELKTKEGEKFVCNGKRIKIYMGYADSVPEVVEAYRLDKV